MKLALILWRFIVVMVAITSASPVLQGQTLSKEKTELIDAATVYIVVTDRSRGASGSGFVVKNDGDDTYIVTNDHVVNFEHAAMVREAEPSGKSKPEITVIFNSGLGAAKERKAKATVMAADPDRDLAVLKVSKVPNRPTPIEYIDSPKPAKLMAVTVFGYPEGKMNALDGLNPTCTTVPTTISNLQPNKSGQVGRIQFNGGATHGSSGGPVVSSADGKLIGVTSSGFDGTAIAFAIPGDEVANVLAGTVGRIRIVTVKSDTGEGGAQLRVNIIDPLKTVKSVAAHYRKNLPEMKADGKPEVMPGATKVNLKIEDGVGVAAIPAPPQDKLVVQVEMQLDGGSLISTPTEIAIAGSIDAAMNRNTIESPAGGKPRIPLPGAGFVELPAMPMIEKPKGSDHATDLSDLNRKPSSYVEKSLIIEGLSSCQLQPADNGNYEITVLTEAGNAPNNVEVLLPKDLAMQVSEVYTVDALGYSYALRLEGKLRKPTRGDVHLFEVSELHFLNPDGKPATSLKSLTVAPKGKATLALVNRFPAEYKGQKVLLDAFVAGVDNTAREFALKVNHETSMPVLNLKFYASKDLTTQVESDLPREGTLARLECIVEAVDPRKGQGILGVSVIEILDGQGKAKKRLASSDKIVYPTVAPVPKNTAPIVAPSESKGNPQLSVAAAPAAASAPKTGNSNLLLFFGVGGGVGILALGLGAFLLFRGGKKKKVATKYPRKTPAENAATAAAAAVSAERTVGAPKSSSKPKSASKNDDNPFANFQ